MSRLSHRSHDLAFEAAIAAGLRACAVAYPEMIEDHNLPGRHRPRIGHVERCRSLIAQGSYETTDRLNLAVDRLAGALN